jgi:two-component system chemotaxis sensor kinase CheA
VGLNLVRATATRLKGDVHLHSEPGQSTTVEISVPISIESVSVLGAVADETTVLLPFRAVRQAVRTTERDFVSSVDGLAILVGDDVIPYRWLGSLLNPFGRGRDVQKSSSVVVVQTGSVRVAVGVDRLMGIRDVVVRPLPSLCGCVPLVAGTALNGLGDPELVLDPATLVATVTAHSEPIRAAKSAPRPTVLVVDDSLTTRMLEQSILEAAGFEVDLATSAEEGLVRAREKPHSMFVVDVEMPGMNGFELLKCFRNDPKLQKTPAIMVTSRASAEDRQCAKDAGARDFIVKSEFEESRLLTIVRSLVQEVSG